MPPAFSSAPARNADKIEWPAYQRTEPRAVHMKTRAAPTTSDTMPMITPPVASSFS